MSKSSSVGHALPVSWSRPATMPCPEPSAHSKAAGKASDPPQASTALKEQRSDYHGGRGCSMNSESCALPTSVCEDDEGVAERYE